MVGTEEIDKLFSCQEVINALMVDRRQGTSEHK